MTPDLRLPCVDDLSWCALTVYLEAEGESWAGKLGIAWAIANRVTRWQKSVSDVVLARFAFSSWNTDSVRRLTLDALDPAIYRDCFKAACAALFALVPDPTNGADHFLNVLATKAMSGGRVPKWAADPADSTRVNVALVTVVIDSHTFLRLT